MRCECRREHESAIYAGGRVSGSAGASLFDRRTCSVKLRARDTADGPRTTPSQPAHSTAFKKNL
eukprot:scaffold17307_cov119-Isochrysis_galbana.AAC.3